MHAFPGLAWGLVRGSVARSSGGAAGRPIALWGGCRAVRTLGLVLVPRIFRRHGVTLSRGPYALAPLIPGSDATSCGSGVSLAPFPNGSRSLPPAGPGPRFPLPPFPFPLPVFSRLPRAFAPPGWLGAVRPWVPSKQPTAAGSLVVCFGFGSTLPPWPATLTSPPSPLRF